MCCGGGDAWPRRKLENSVERGVAASHHILMMAVMKLEAMIPGEPAMDDRRRGGGKTFSFPPMREAVSTSLCAPVGATRGRGGRR